MRMCIREDVQPLTVVRLPLTDGSPLVQLSPVSSFLLQEQSDFETGDVFYSYGSDLTAIFNQQRLGKEIGPILDSVFKNVRQGDLSDKFAGLSDDEIVSCVKSRFIQAPCEIQDWTRYLMSELTAVVEKQQQNETSEVQQPDNQGVTSSTSQSET